MQINEKDGPICLIYTSLFAPMQPYLAKFQSILVFDIDFCCKKKITTNSEMVRVGRFLCKFLRRIQQTSGEPQPPHNGHFPTTSQWTLPHRRTVGFVQSPPYIRPSPTTAEWTIPQQRISGHPLTIVVWTIAHHCTIEIHQSRTVGNSPPSHSGISPLLLYSGPSLNYRIVGYSHPPLNVSSPRIDQ